jgi:hypothetical protein
LSIVDVSKPVALFCVLLVSEPSVPLPSLLQAANDKIIAAAKNVFFIAEFLID